MLYNIYNEKETVLKLTVPLIVTLLSPDLALSNEDSPVNTCSIRIRTVFCVVQNTSENVFKTVNFEFTYTIQETDSSIVQERVHYPYGGLEPGETISVSFPITARINNNDFILSDYGIIPQY